ncbi:MAG: hypothetical protein JST81_15155 [Bacteroidetes bacterium]|nr:hypothetical protein [Bacteroidota bacterium]
MTKKLLKTDNTKVEHIKGRYQILTALLVILIGTPVTYYFTKGSDKPTVTKTNQVNAKEVKNSPIANDIQTQNINYYAAPEKTVPVEPKQPTVTRVVYKEKPEPVKQDTTPKQSTVINADHALIVTNGQSGGNNTVITPTVALPEPTVEMKIDSLNIPTHKIRFLGFIEDTLRNVQQPDASVTFYKTQLSLDYFANVAKNQLFMAVVRKDVIYFDAGVSGVNNTYKGLTKGNYPGILFHQPQNGRYTLFIYTLNPITDINKDIYVKK